MAGLRDCRFSFATFIWESRAARFSCSAFLYSLPATAQDIGAGSSWSELSLRFFCLGALSLFVRRLHDLGFSGYHVIWVAAAQLISTVLSYGPLKAVLLSLPFAIVGLWLLFWPGNKKANRFGEVPG